jgi:tRNA (cytidine32/uridine32-2'-O)-methyltransferase
MDHPASLPIRFVLVETRHPGNLGAAARAMHTMGLHDLALVAPDRFPDAEATALASGADDLLTHARVEASVAAAVADCALVLATTARRRTQYYWPALTAREAGLQAVAAAARGRVAVLFGSERTGLSNADLELCQALVHIPTASGSAALNLAQAVQVLAYEIHVASTAPRPAVPRATPRPPAAEFARLIEHLGAVLEDINFTDRLGGAHLRRRLTRIFARAELDQLEVNILRGILTAVQAKRHRAGS